MRRDLATLARRYLPAGAVGRLYEWRRALRRWRFRLRQLVAGRRVAAADCRLVLGRLGVGHGDVVMVHSALSRLGEVEGGAEKLLEVLLDAVGPEGTLVMPAFPTIGGMAAHLAAHPLFDAARDPSRMGQLTERLRLHPLARRSLHPTHSVVAVGPKAEYLADGHECCSSPFGAESPFRKLLELDGKIVCLGVEIAYVSSLHLPEEMVRNFPVKVYLDRPVQARVVDQDGREHTVTTLVHDPAVAATRIEKNPRLLAELRRILRERGILREEQLGTGLASLLGARALEECLEELAATGLTIYSVRGGV